MLLLTSSSDSLSLVTSASASIDVHASWVDNVSGAITPGRTNTATISTNTTTPIVAGPSAGQRNVKALTIRNRHASTACDVTIKHTDGTNNLELIKTTLAAGEELIYFDDLGFTQFLSSGALKGTFNPALVGITGGTITGTDINTLAGATTGAGFTLTSGTLTTTPAAGDIEYDGVIAYLTDVANERQVIDAEQFITMQGGTFTLTSATSPQKLFNSPTNGQLSVGGTRTYQFECEFDLSSLSATSGSFGFSLQGSATYSYLKWWSEANKATLATQVAAQHTMNPNSLTNIALTAANTNTVGWAIIRGIVRVNAGGTIIPSVTLGVAAAAVVGRDSFFRLWPLGTGTVTSLGNWS